MRAAASGVDDQARATEYLAMATGQLYNIEHLLADALIQLGAIQRNTADASLDLMMQTQLLSESLRTQNDALQAAIMTLMAYRAALNDAGGATVRTAATTGRTGGMIAQWWGQWGKVVHWIVMGTLEIAATAIPALVALGAAAAAMAPTFTHIADQMSYLRNATGSWSGVMAASVGPLQAAGAAGVRLRAAVAPDAYVIFGAAINAITGHVGAFAGIAQQASNVLAAFATKLSTELSGQTGTQLAKFFTDAVKYMIQWGQVLGNLGHAFIDAASHMFGVGQALLNVLVLISRAFLAIADNPVGGFLIGLGALLSGVYRYAVLLANAFTYLGGKAAVSALRGLFVQVVELIAVFPELVAEIGFADAALAVFEDLMGPVGWMILGIAAVIGVWKLATATQTDATDKLIATINKMTPSLVNNRDNIATLEGHLYSLEGALGRADAAYATMTGVVSRYSGANHIASIATTQTTADIAKSIAEIRKLAEESVNLVTGMAEAGVRTGALGAALQAQTIQTAISDSHIQQLNQAIDQYIGLLAGATSGNANFITSMSNIGSVNATVSNNLGTSTVQLRLNAQAFGQALSRMGTVGAAAWQNFDQVLTGSISPMMDELRQLGVTGALTGKQVSQAAIDMAVQWGRYAGSNKTAQAQVMGFLRAQGLIFPSFHKFMQDARAAGAGQHQLNGIVDKGTIAFANLSQMAKNAANAMNPIVANAIDKAALQSSGFNTALGKLQTDMQNHAPAAAIQADMQAVNSSYQDALTMAEKTGEGIQTSAQKAASGTRSSTQQMEGEWGRAKGKQMELASQVQVSSAQIGAHTQSAASQVKGAMSTMSSAMDAARMHATWLQQYIDQMHGKTIQVNTIFTNTGTPSKTGYHGMIAGLQGGGFIGGQGGVDRIPAMLTSGEAVLSRAAVTAMGAANVMALNARPSAETMRSLGGGGGGGGILALTQHVEVALNGSKMGKAWRTDLLVYNRRNPSANTGLRVR